MKKVLLNEMNTVLNGFPWFDHNHNKLWRLPIELEDQVSRELWIESILTSGGRIRFRSDTTLLGVFADYCKLTEFSNPGHYGSRGMDVYVDGQFWNCICPKKAGEFEGYFFENASRKLREFTIYLPLFSDLEKIKIIFDDYAKILPPSPFRTEKPVVFYGTSITHGACASRPGLTYEAVLCRMLGIDFVNLGFNGMGKGEMVVAKAIADIDAACYIMDFGQNNKDPKQFAQIYLPFVSEIKKTRAETPIILTTPLLDTGEFWKEEFKQSQDIKRQVVIDAFNKLSSLGDKNVYLAQWNKLIDLTDGDGLVDGCHPNDLGFNKMSYGLKDLVQQVLSLKE